MAPMFGMIIPDRKVPNFWIPTLIEDFFFSWAIDFPLYWLKFILHFYPKLNGKRLQ